MSARWIWDDRQNHLVSNKREWNNCFIENKQEILLDLADFALQEQPEDNLTVTISRAWYNDSYTIAAKPIKSLELHYTMIKFLIKKYMTVLFRHRSSGSPLYSVLYKKWTHRRSQHQWQYWETLDVYPTQNSNLVWAIADKGKKVVSWITVLIKNNQEILLDLADFALQEQPEDNFLLAIFRAWHNGSYTMAA